MQAAAAIDLCREAMYVALLAAAPTLIVGLLAGLVIGLLQALTQIQDQTVSFVPKLIAMALALALTLPWVLQHLVDYAQALFQNIPKLVMGG